LVAPHTAHVIGLFQNQILIDALLLQCDGHAQARKAGADDEDLEHVIGTGGVGFLANWHAIPPGSKVARLFNTTPAPHMLT
jgi:hypothetical protein